jgi:predicted dehydrogenase
MEKKLAVGLIGCGGIAQAMHLPGWANCRRAQVVACFDVDPARAEEVARKFGIARVCQSLKELLALDEVAAVDVCTPNFDHAPTTLAAFRAGKHVYCEKPIALNGREGATMVAAAKKARRKLMIGLHNRFRGDVAFVKSLIDAGRLGKVYYAHSVSIRRRGVPSWGVFGQKKLQGGGPLIDIGVHAIDLAWYLLGCPKPVAVSGKCYETIGKTPGHFGQFGAWDWKKYDVEDFAVALVRFADGQTMSIESAFCVNLPENREAAVDVVGDKGGASVKPLKVCLEENGTLLACEPQYVTDPAPPHHLALWAFADAVLDDKPVAIPGEQALTVQKIVDGLYKSSQLSREVKIV